MDDDNATGLIDLSTIDLDDLRFQERHALRRAWTRLAEDADGAVAGFQSAAV
ncbi:hypothetical protein [Nonomuraea jiangxiensis]|uniref:FXSXX-COOH protein n=1 Tax=Nonomuraea jiangxiensis TaxID=633440 RepID=A0A1G9FAI6_9ACTN|nr:hypothetical protein [Nonomuraea jiangxiensis]SDK85404.1 hypothetical protein SAMN05421869_119156 [Nonomuraea jiangxiensis]